MGRRALASRLRPYGTRPRVASRARRRRRGLSPGSIAAGEQTNRSFAPADGVTGLYRRSSAASRRLSFFAARFSFTDFAGFLALFFFGDLSPISKLPSIPRALTKHYSSKN